MLEADQSNTAQFTPIRLIVGLGNPGTEFNKTRHNVGVWFIKRLVESNAAFHFQRKFQAQHQRVIWNRHTIDLLIPMTYMNNSGRSVAAFAFFYHIPPSSVLIAHDDLDLPIGTVRFKKDGGAGGHKGLEDIIRHLNSQDFFRVRIGIGRPMIQDKMIIKNYVLQEPSQKEHRQIDQAIERAIQALPFGLQGDWQRAMNQLHMPQ